MTALGDIAERFAGGYAHVTTRGSLQMREIQPGSVIGMIEALEAAGLTAQGTGADSARNLTASPTAGFDPVELHRPLRLCQAAFASRILRTRELQGIPRKFNISFDNAGSHFLPLSDTNDIGFLAVDVQENDQGVAPGIWCRIPSRRHHRAQGFRPRYRAWSVAPRRRSMSAEAMLQGLCRAWQSHQSRQGAAEIPARFGKGFDWFCARTQEMLDTFGSNVHPPHTALACEHDAPRPAIDRQGHIGVHKQKQPGLNYIGAALELGRLSPEQMRGLGRIAQRVWHK